MGFCFFVIFGEGPVSVIMSGGTVRGACADEGIGEEVSAVPKSGSGDDISLSISDLQILMRRNSEYLYLNVETLRDLISLYTNKTSLQSRRQQCELEF